jgi:uncharacterized surface protein with fasciclin (FAS1) repeats
MRFRIFAVAALAAGAEAQSLAALLASTPDLSNLTSYLKLFPSLVASLSSAKNITILAPSNEAFAKILNAPAAAAITTNDTALIQAVVTYHILNGTYPASAVESTPAFIPTLLDNPQFENVTGGQVVEAVTEGTNVVFISGLLARSVVTKAVCSPPLSTLAY